MSYKVAIASSDGRHVDLPFGEAPEFLIYEVDGNGEYVFTETRKWEEEALPAGSGHEVVPEKERGCGPVPCTGNGTRCGGAYLRKVELVEDCRAVICSDIGFKVRKQFASRTISVFDITGDIQKIIETIISYYDRIDHHRTPSGVETVKKTK